MSLSLLLSVRDAAQAVAISPWTLRKWLAKGVIPYVRLGRRVLIEPAQLETLIAESRHRGRL